MNANGPLTLKYILEWPSGLKLKCRMALREGTNLTSKWPWQMTIICDTVMMLDIVLLTFYCIRIIIIVTVIMSEALLPNYYDCDNL